MSNFYMWRDRIPNFVLPLLVATFLLGGCATTSEPKDVADRDPFETVNRKVYTFNTALDRHLVKPVADAYTFVTPQLVQKGVSNFFTNLTNINVVLNDLLQGKVSQGFQDTGRFAINSTVGLLGLVDVATYVGLDQHDEDFGQTLGVWGVSAGPYLVLPFFGPTTLRETPAYAVDAVTNPVTSIYPPLMALEAIDARARADGAIKFIDEAALDPYVFTRESYLQWREYLVHDGEPPVREVDEYDEAFDAFDEAFDDEAESEETGSEQEMPSIQSKGADSSDASTTVVETRGCAEGGVCADESLDRVAPSLPVAEPSTDTAKSSDPFPVRSESDAVESGKEFSSSETGYGDAERIENVPADARVEVFSDTAAGF